MYVHESFLRDSVPAIDMLLYQKPPFVRFGRRDGIRRGMIIGIYTVEYREGNGENPI